MAAGCPVFGRPTAAAIPNIVPMGQTVVSMNPDEPAALAPANSPPAGPAPQRARNCGWPPAQEAERWGWAPPRPACAASNGQVPRPKLQLVGPESRLGPISCWQALWADFVAWACGL